MLTKDEIYLPDRDAIVSTRRPAIKLPKWQIEHDGKYCHVTQWRIDAPADMFVSNWDGALEYLKSNHHIVVDAPDDLAARYRVLLGHRKAKLDSLLTPVLRHIDAGHWNDEVIRLAAHICDAEGWPTIAQSLRELPAKSQLGQEEQWCIAALNLFGKEMWVWCSEYQSLMADAQKWLDARAAL